MYDLEPWGDDWQQAALIASKVHNSFAAERISAAELIPTIENRRQSDEVDDKSLGQIWKQRLGF